MGRHERGYSLPGSLPTVVCGSVVLWVDGEVDGKGILRGGIVQWLWMGYEL